MWRAPRAEQIMLTLPEHLMILPVFVGFTLLVLYFFCRVRVQFCLFALSLLFHVISISPCFWSMIFLSLYLYDFLDYPCGLLLRYIRLPIFYIYILLMINLNKQTDHLRGGIKWRRVQTFQQESARTTFLAQSEGTQILANTPEKNIKNANKIGHYWIRLCIWSKTTFDFENTF